MPAATTTFLFDEPRSEIAAHILERASKAEAIDIVTGFATLDGLKKIIQPIEKDPQKLRSIVIGKATTRACDALDYLDKIKVPKDRLKIHLGFAKDNTHLRNGEKYRPMIHSKLIYLDLPDNKACAFIGSHNLTAFALSGENGEAGVLIEGDRDDENLKKVKKQINAINNDASIYDPKKRGLYIQWNQNYMIGFQSEMFPEEDKDPRTVLIFATTQNCDPEINKNISIKLSKSSFPNIQGAEVHLYIFDELPKNAKEAYYKRENSQKKFIGKIEDANSNKREGNLVINYSILDNENPCIIEQGNLVLISEPDKNENRCIFTINSILSGDYEYDRKNPALKPIPTLGISNFSSSWKTVQDLSDGQVKRSKFELPFDQNEDEEILGFEYVMVSYYKKPKYVAEKIDRQPISTLNLEHSLFQCNSSSPIPSPTASPA